MHTSAYKTARQFLDLYATALPAGRVIEIGSRLVALNQKTLRALCPGHLEYLGIDLEPGINVDVVLGDPYAIPLADASVDIALCTSVFEHCDFFWALFEEILRVLRIGGLLYVNAPTNGYVHRHPVDCWRFYPDSGEALVQWGRLQGHDVALLESFITDQDLSVNPYEIWNDFVAVFIKGAEHAIRYPRRMTDLRTDYANARRSGYSGLKEANLLPGRSQEDVSHSGHNRKSGSRGVYLYQIAYSEETWNSVPEGMLPLDNRANNRPDWREYWPIRRFLQSEVLDEKAFYGFLSPRFYEKLPIMHENLIEFISSVADDVEVTAFSTGFDLRVMFRNVFEQGEHAHPGFMDLAQQVVDELLPGIDLRQLVNNSATAILCNYFAAKPRFWREWLALCERVFTMAESKTHPCATALNRGYFYGNARPTVAAKVFIIERVASLLLSTSIDFKIEKYPKSNLTYLFEKLPHELFHTLDELKSLGVMGHPMLLDAFAHIQREILNSEDARKERDYILSRNQELKLGHTWSRGFEHWGSASALSATDQETVGLGWILRRLIR